MLRKSNLGIRVFSEQQCQELHSAAMEVLERVGSRSTATRRSRSRKAPAPTWRIIACGSLPLVEKCIRSAPSRVVLCDRDGGRKMMLEGDRFYFGPGPTTIHTIDSLTGERRVPGLADTQRASRVMDALPNIDCQMDFGSIGDVDARIMDVHASEALLNNSTKPIVDWAYNAQNCQAMIDMAAEVAGGLASLQVNPSFAIYSEPVSPLMHEFDALDVAMLMAKNSLPAIYTPAPLGRATAPATLAGIIVISLCESLSGLVLH